MASWFILRLDTSEVEPTPEPGEGLGERILAGPLIHGRFRTRILASVALRRRFVSGVRGRVSTRRRFEVRSGGAAQFSRQVEMRVPAVRLASARYDLLMREDEEVLLSLI